MTERSTTRSIREEEIPTADEQPEDQEETGESPTDLNPPLQESDIPLEIELNPST